MNASSASTRRKALLLLLAIWGVTCAFMLIQNWHLIGPLELRDTDDALRLVQVRDLLGGQSWFDLTQHRLHPPEGVPMHWSRLVDLPIALVLASLKPLLGNGLAERATLVIIPFSQLLLLMGVVYAFSRRLGLAMPPALLAVALLGTSLSIIAQFAPLRIDHHGPQILCGAVAMLALVSTMRRDGRMGLVAGTAMACWLQISLEGLPCAVVIGGVFAVRHLLRADCWPDTRNYLIALTGASALLLFGTRYPSDALIPWCDSFSPAFIVPLAITCLTALILAVPMRRNSLTSRAAPLVLGGLAGAAYFLLTARQCLAGPFDTLDPLVYNYWYKMVLEGQPITSQKPDMQCIIVASAMLGLAGSFIGLRRAAKPELRMAWFSLIVVQIASFALALDVMRAMGFAHLVALPGNAVLLMKLGGLAQRLRTMPMRVVLTAGVGIASPFGTMAIASAFDPSNHTDNSQHHPTTLQCTAYPALRGLEALPAGIIFSPLDIGSHILAYTHHSIVATGHHRNRRGMYEVVSAFMATPQEAQRTIMASPARYVAICPDFNEVMTYRRARPNSLAAELLAGRHPAWLAPIPMRAGETIQVYRILRAAPTA